MKIYYIEDSYIWYLKQYDKNVPNNKKESRPYVGIALDVNGIKYYVPFTSPKDKYRKMNNGKDFRKIQGGLYGGLDFNNMILVVDEALMLVDINNEPDIQYRRLLQNQYVCIKKDREAIKKAAKELYMLFFTVDEKLSKYDLRVKNRCCQFDILEYAMSMYQQGR